MDAESTAPRRSLPCQNLDEKRQLWVFEVQRFPPPIPRRSDGSVGLCPIFQSSAAQRTQTRCSRPPKPGDGNNSDEGKGRYRSLMFRPCCIQRRPNQLPNEDATSSFDMQLVLDLAQRLTYQRYLDNDRPICKPRIESPMQVRTYECDDLVRSCLSFSSSVAKVLKEVDMGGQLSMTLACQLSNVANLVQPTCGLGIGYVPGKPRGRQNPAGTKVSK